MSEQDSSLVLLRPEKDSFKFILLVFIVFTFLTVSWYLMVDSRIKEKIPMSFTTTESNAVKVIKILTEPEASAALVGTSVMDRLRPEFFSQTGLVANLALEGGSSVTGLEIILRGQVTPSIVYIETNYLANHPDTGLLSETSGRLRMILSGLTKPFRFLLSSKTYKSSYVSWESIQKTLLSQKEIDYQNKTEVQKGVDWYNSEAGKESRQDPAPMMKRIEDIALQLEKKGIHVFYVNIPMDPAYEETSFFTSSRNKIAGSDKYQCARCLDLKQIVDLSKLRWTDGIHLDNRSAFLVARAIEDHIKLELSFTK